ncbi:MULTISPECIES: flagellar biosynthetic protein FliR [Carboxydothermus]|uniref:Flagellar biosynthetic protein FliR n=2 Tax=Carboxydothermus TaxID=129957 RepID=Q3ADD0_CARHZ|nr:MULTISPECIES: flagellar biosynthetic protein FliR [Carboxydothermus]ABB15993.1 flagellar biosynthetic protein FliR [Carboxydothermus hydrogenoformans Z-2901]NYE56910.1 flagellar biosynthetic protein FliR [Carboxydothermus ferrireducens DSM 11255]
MTQWLIFLIIAARLAGFFGISPLIIPVRGVPPAVKGFFTLIVAYLLLPTVAGSFTATDVQRNFFLLLIGESLIGLLLGFVTLIFANLYLVAGQYMDLTSGLSAATLFDPLTQTNAGLMANFIYLYGILNYFLANGHHRLLTFLTVSFELIPPGKGLLHPGLSELLIKIFALVMLVAIEIAIPFLMVMLISDLALGILARTAPQMNVFLLSFGLKILLAIFTLWLLLPGIAYFTGIYLELMEKNLLAIIRGIGYGR